MGSVAHGATKEGVLLAEAARTLGVSYHRATYACADGHLAAWFDEENSVWVVDAYALEEARRTGSVAALNRCSRCKDLKSPGEFPPSKRTASGFSGVCWPCYELGVENRKKGQAEYLKKAQTNKKKAVKPIFDGKHRRCGAGMECVSYAILGEPSKLAGANKGPYCYACDDAKEKEPSVAVEGLRERL